MFTNIKKFINNSLFMENINNITFIMLLMVLFSAIVCSSEMMGLLSLCFSSLVIFKIVANFQKIKLENFENAIIVYFLIVTLSLCGSSLFSLSLHGYLKTFIYILFFLCATQFFKENKEKISFTILFVACLMSYESIIALIQNSSGVVEISGWQDMSRINPEQVISRAYGTLQPYNPNLLAGYLLCGLSSFIYLMFNNLREKRKKFALVFSVLFLINLLAIMVTGCRGAYLGFLLFFPCLILTLIVYAKKKFGGLSNIKKRYKNVIVIVTVFLFGYILTNPALIKRFESIFSLRQDSSISFRLNVYESAWRMFLDNPFLGIGVGNQNFREIYGLYMKTGYDALGSYCVPLEMIVESGIFALVAFVVFLYFVVKKAGLIILNKNVENKRKILAFSVILMLLAVIGHGMFDTIWYRPQVQFLFWTYIAMLKD